MICNLVSAAKHTIGSQTNKAGTIRYQGTHKKKHLQYILDTEFGKTLLSRFKVIPV
jgi:hypothetical protein